MNSKSSTKSLLLETIQKNSVLSSSIPRSRVEGRPKKSRKSTSLRVHLYASPYVHESMDWLSDWHSESKKDLLDKILSGASCDLFEQLQMFNDLQLEPNWVRKTYVISRAVIESDVRLLRVSRARDYFFTIIVLEMDKAAREVQTSEIEAIAKVRPILQLLYDQVIESVAKIREIVPDNGSDFSEYLEEGANGIGTALGRCMNEDMFEDGGTHDMPDIATLAQNFWHN